MAAFGQLPVQDDCGGGCSEGEVFDAWEPDGEGAVGRSEEPVYSVV